MYPFDHPKAVAAVSATHTKKPADGQASRKERRKAQYSTRKPQGTLAVAQVSYFAGLRGRIRRLALVGRIRARGAGQSVP